jgi:hypothetical protein
VEPKEGLSLCEDIYTPYKGDNTLVGSTDVGSVSWVVPTVQMRGATCAIGTPLHSWQMVAQGKLPAAHKGMAHAAKVMGSTAIELLRDPAADRESKAGSRKTARRNRFRQSNSGQRSTRSARKCEIMQTGRQFLTIQMTFNPSILTRPGAS